MRAQIVTALALFFVIMVSGCTSKVGHDKVVGNFEVRYTYGTEKLQLHKDRTYVQSVFINGERAPKTNNGRWEFDEEYSEVILFDAMMVDDGFGRLEPAYWKTVPGASRLAARKSLGKVSLFHSGDRDFVFKKEK